MSKHHPGVGDTGRHVTEEVHMSKHQATRRGRPPGVTGRKVSVVLAEAIADGIIARSLRPGNRLPTEAEMGVEFGHGRGTVREALRILESQGIVEVRPGANGGPYVVQPEVPRLARLLSLMLRMSDVSVREVFDARLIIEPALASLAAVHCSADQLTALRVNQEQLAVSPISSEEFLALNEEFHTLLADASGNRPLAALWSALGAIADGHQAGVRYAPSVLSGAAAAHAKIVATVEQGDPAAAAAAMTEHLTAAQQYIGRYYAHLLDGPIGIVPSSE